MGHYKNSHLGRPYLVPKFPRIKEVMDSIWSNFRPNTGDIVTRYAINMKINIDILITVQILLTSN